ncbi:damage-inducible protein DinB [Rhodobacterales bacterium HKCCE2091]|nr:damage-inducible protein DinB [Rhodobacterales bacterium HKCCE2091]
MITPGYVRTMARYNAWQNGCAYRVAEGLGDDARRQDRGAFFGSIHRTLSHLVWGDMMWMSRFDGGEKPGGEPGGVDWLVDWDELKARRAATDARIADWAAGVTQDTLDGDLTWYSGLSKAEMSKPMALCVVHFFNHETHHRGQVHAMLTAAGAKTGVTDLAWMPDEIPEWP